MNFSTRYYAALALRDHTVTDEPGDFILTDLLPPGAMFRADFGDFTASTCPTSLDVRVFLYRRVKDGQDPPVPIGLDEGEAVEPEPIVAAQIDDIPGPCGGIIPLGIYTIVNREAPTGTARVKFAQDSEIDAMLRASNRFPNPDAAWEVTGVDPDLKSAMPPAQMASVPIAGRVVLADGTGLSDVGILLCTKFRVRLDDADPNNDPDSGFSEPIDYVVTDATGAFTFDRPPGTYQLEFFSDEYAFRPYLVEVESPVSTIAVIAEPF
ncbi:MAG: hypothetical protein JXA69_20660 [Phycisphaerae bacterium]|nr:hypothetical protein [Phycisphaerae bacterium]